jgi:hypothetical protein
MNGQLIYDVVCGIVVVTAIIVVASYLILR